ncbi:hypothetical protein UlMin_024686 [Ulmus minor]
MAHSIEAPDCPLRNVVDAVQTLVNTINSENPHIMITQFVEVPRRFDMSVFGIAFVYLNWQIEEKVDLILQGSTPEETLQALLERNIAERATHNGDNGSINVIRMTRMIEMAKILLQHIRINEGSDSIIEPMRTAYDQVFGPYHGTTVKKTVYALMELFPTKSNFINIILDDNENLAQELIGNYIAASEVVINYIHDVFMSKEEGAQLLRQI